MLSLTILRVCGCLMTLSADAGSGDGRRRAGRAAHLRPPAVGAAVSHSLAPAVHRAAGGASRLQATYFIKVCAMLRSTLELELGPIPTLR